MENKILDIDKIIIQKYGENDFAFYSENGDFSVRGTSDEVLEELVECVKHLMK